MEKTSTKLYDKYKPLVVKFIKLFYNLQVKGIENIPRTGAALLVGNHRNNIDPLLVCASEERVVHFVAKKELYNFLTKHIMNNVGTIKFDRSLPTDTDAIKEIIKTIRKGELIGIFPEGGRNKTNQILLPLKDTKGKGTISLAHRYGIPIIPFAITRNYKLIRKSDVTLEFGTPFYTRSLTGDEAIELMEEKIKRLVMKNKIYN